MMRVWGCKLAWIGVNKRWKLQLAQVEWRVELARAKGRRGHRRVHIVTRTGVTEL